MFAYGGNTGFATSRSWLNGYTTHWHAACSNISRSGYKTKSNHSLIPATATYNKHNNNYNYNYNLLPFFLCWSRDAARVSSPPRSFRDKPVSSSGFAVWLVVSTSSSPSRPGDASRTASARGSRVTKQQPAWPQHRRKAQEMPKRKLVCDVLQTPSKTICT